MVSLYMLAQAIDGDEIMGMVLNNLIIHPPNISWVPPRAWDHSDYVLGGVSTCKTGALPACTGLPGQGETGIDSH